MGTRPLRRGFALVTHIIPSSGGEEGCWTPEKVQEE
jgi:hypothetical protein